METRIGRNVAPLACVLVFVSGLLFGIADDQFSDWSAPVNLGPIVNSAANDAGPFISADGLSLYLTSSRAGGFGGNDIWVSQRARAADPWGPPQNLGGNINSPSNEQTPTLSIDGHHLYFTSDRPGGLGGYDLYVSRRHNKRADLSWQPPSNLGSGVNSFANDLSPALFEDDATGTITLYFYSNRPGGPGLSDIYASTLQPNETFGMAALVTELSSPFADAWPAIRRDGLEILLVSDRPGTLGLFDLWASRRRSTADFWSTPVNLGPVVNSTANDLRPALSFDGAALYFASDRSGGAGALDLYLSGRAKLKKRD